MRMARLATVLVLLMSASAHAEDKMLSATVMETKPGSGSADLTTCTQGKEKRTVEMTYGNSDTKLPCAVHYKKPTEQPEFDKVVFQADHDAAFCQAKAQAFVEKLSKMGWTCGKGS